MSTATTTTTNGKITIPVKGLKVHTMISPAALPSGWEPRDPIIDLAIEGSPLVVRARLNPKSVRKVMAAIAEHGPDGVYVTLQGNIKAGAGGGGPYILDCAGISAGQKVAKGGPA